LARWFRQTDYSADASNMLKLGAGITAAQLVVTGHRSGNLTLTDGTHVIMVGG
jgi:hypothetical protein